VRTGRAQAGFTLLEVVVAAAIMAVGLTAVLSVYGGAVRLASQASGYEQARLEAERLMAELLAAPPKAPFTQGGDCMRPQGARYTLAGSLDPGLPGLTNLAVTVDFFEPGGMRRLTLRTAQADTALPVVTGAAY
jgi:general secretion pathway protein I